MLLLFHSRSRFREPSRFVWLTNNLCESSAQPEQNRNVEGTRHMSETKFLRRASPGWALALLAAIATCGFIDRIIMNVLVQPIKLEFGLTDTQVGLVTGLAFAVLNVLLGIWVAR